MKNSSHMWAGIAGMTGGALIVVTGSWVVSVGVGLLMGLLTGHLDDE